jgi:hypothetical protein
VRRAEAGVAPLLLLLAALICGSRADAQPVGSDAASLQLDASGCGDAAWLGELERLVQVELRGAAEDGPAAALHVIVRCEGDQVALEVGRAAGAGANEGLNAESTRRAMDLGATAESVRGRVVALAIAGLARELEVMGASERESVEEQRERQVVEEQQARAEPLEVESAGDRDEEAAGHGADGAVQIEALLVAAGFSDGRDVLWGAGARGEYRGLSPWRLALDAQVGTYADERELGHVRLLSGSVGARVGVALIDRSIGLTVGLGQRIGWARASAAAQDAAVAHGDNVAGVWAAPFAFAGLDVAVHGPLRLGLDAEFGAVLLPLRGRVERGGDLAADGAWGALAATFGGRF